MTFWSPKVFTISPSAQLLPGVDSPAGTVLAALLFPRPATGPFSPTDVSEVCATSGLGL